MGVYIYRANGRFRRNLVIAGPSGEGPFTIRFADVPYRALSACEVVFLGALGGSGRHLQPR